MKKQVMKKILIFLTALCLTTVGMAIFFFKPLPDDMLPGEQEANPVVKNTEPLPANSKIDHIVVFKSQRQMRVYQGEKLMKIYPISLGDQPVGHKQFEGDEKTPEGIYRINERNPNSRYHKNLGISYPNAQDKAYAQSQGKSPGGLIKIHGLPNGMGQLGRQHLRDDWTNGCIAVTDNEIDELYQHVVHNAVIDIRP